jgi:hypothetical protein
MFFIGIDVSKAKLDCSLLLDTASTKRRAKAAANSRAGVAELLAWCTKHNADATNTPSLIRQSIIDAITFLEKQLAKLQQDIDEHINKHPNLKADRDLLISIPAVGPQVGNHLLSVMHNYQFQAAEQLAAYLGLVLIERQSGTSVRGRPRLSKAGPARIRAVLYMVAIVGTQHIIRISKHCINACNNAVKPKCLHSALPCANWCIYALACLKLVNLMANYAI